MRARPSSGELGETNDDLELELESDVELDWDEELVDEEVCGKTTGWCKRNRDLAASHSATASSRRKFTETGGGVERAGLVRSCCRLFGVTGADNGLTTVFTNDDTFDARASRNALSNSIAIDAPVCRLAFRFLSALTPIAPFKICALAHRAEHFCRRGVRRRPAMTARCMAE